MSAALSELEWEGKLSAQLLLDWGQGVHHGTYKELRIRIFKSFKVHIWKDIGEEKNLLILSSKESLRHVVSNRPNDKVIALGT